MITPQNTETYCSPSFSLNSMNINNPYIDLKSKSVYCIMNFLSDTDIINSKTIRIDSPNYDSIINTNALIDKIEKYYNIKATTAILPPELEYNYKYNPKDYAPKC